MNWAGSCFGTRRDNTNLGIAPNFNGRLLQSNFLSLPILSVAVCIQFHEGLLSEDEESESNTAPTRAYKYR